MQNNYKEIPLTKGYVAIVDENDFDRLSQWKWNYNAGYAVRTITFSPPIDGKKQRKAVLMHRVVSEAENGTFVDHINGDCLDNRKTNLRICTQSDNCKNRKKIAGCSSKYKGVTWHKTHQMWQSYIRVNKKLIYLGLHENEDSAAISYNKAALKYHSEFAKLNEVRHAKG